MNSTELAHYGVKGMRWGVRRSVRLSTSNISDLVSVAKKVKDALGYMY